MITAISAPRRPGLALGTGVLLLILSVASGVSSAPRETPSAQLERTWGINLDSSSSFSQADHKEDNDPDHTVTAALWIRSLLVLSRDRSVEMIAQGSYTWSDDREYLFNVDTLRATGRFPGLLGETSMVRATAGRFHLRDTTGLVLSHVADGLQLRVSYPFARLRLAGGYTGLLLNPVSDIRMTETDLTESDDDDTFFGPARLLGVAEITFSDLPRRQSLSAAVTAQKDLRDADDDETTFDSLYATIALSGPLAGNLYHSLSGTVMAGSAEADSTTKSSLGFLAEARLRYYREALAGSRLGANFTWASGDEGGADRFVPITRGTAGTILDLPLEDILRGEIFYSFRPFPGIQPSLTVGWFFLASDERPQTPEVDTDSDGRFLGTEVVGRLVARPVSDLGIQLTGGAFFPASGSSGVFTSDRKTEYLLKIEISTSL
ncbi:hypothetical protein SAMN05920897_11783 [Alkalispirochaeta americana]|uniref:Alginate export domain-containing protein n=1 Tax=Alkalispirochaeta americana TaxID=159291 RepID=A0A1N6WIS0_9SPIO|nr:hypothetical protein [Alkalispirochaeta americana]SIQ89898.1 hypothetical protein SAMN05920897_11783 [Alkalispirochaeta americana]